MNMDRANRWLILGANIGVIVGLGLLIVEIQQNSELMRAEIHSIRAEGKANRQMDLANNGVALAVLADAMEKGFPGDPDVFGTLPLVDRSRIRLMYTAILEVMENWYIQCQYGMLNEELCLTTQRGQLVSMLPLIRAVGIDLSSNTPSFVAEIQRLSREAGLPVPNNDGTYPDKK